MTNDTHLTTWEFKGVEIKPLSLVQKAHITSLLSSSFINGSFGPSEVALFLYACICPEAELRKGKRNPAWFDEQVDVWIEKVQFNHSEDFGNGAELMKEILNHSEKNQAEPIVDNDMLKDPDSGN